MLFPVLSPRRPSLVFRYVVMACTLVLLGCLLFPPSELHFADTVAQLHQKHRLHYQTPAGTQQAQVVAESSQNPGKAVNGAKGKAPVDSSSTQARPKSDQHPIDHLIHTAETSFQDMVAKETHSVREAAEAYRKRRGRHPPPGFDAWYQFAAERSAVIVEDFWDQIYHDLHPFWALPAKLIQRGARDFEMTISVRNGHATAGSDWFWTRIWLDMIRTVEHLLPDMDIALNAMDEPRLVVPWETMRNYVVEAERTMGMAKPEEVIGAFQRLGASPSDDKPDTPIDRAWETSGPYWDIVRRGCAPSSPARQAATMTDFSGPPHIACESASLHMYGGFVANSSQASDVCHQPDLQGLNGIFIEPLSLSSTTSLFPLFGGSKLSVNSDILLPAPMYWSEEERFTAGGAQGVDWAGKTEGAIWRGVATGGRNRASNWRGFHRHRFVAMNNGTTLADAEARGGAQLAPMNFELPAPGYQLAAQREGRLGRWAEQWSDCSFVHLMCSEKSGPGESGDGGCPYTGPFFSVGDTIPLQEQLHHKYLPDIDGNSFSGRYLAFLRSSSLPIKATLWREWHDARLVAWKHYVPMDNRFGDWFGIMEYFLGYNSSRGAGSGEDRPRHDEAAHKIASEGKAWAGRVMRKEDMQVYVLRLLLEYARVADERREVLGWVGDLAQKTKDAATSQ